MKTSATDVQAILENATQLLGPEEVAAAVRRIAGEITAVLDDQQPLVLAVMRGGVVFAGQLLPLLPFPLEFDYVDVTRYGSALNGGALDWRVDVPAAVRGRVILVVDDILDAGHTLAAIRERLLIAGADKVLFAGRAQKPSATFLGENVAWEKSTVN